MIFVEALTGGLVTARDPALLEPGELTVATNGIYRPTTDALSIVKGRGTAVGTSPPAATARGVRAIPFDGVTPINILAAWDTQWYYTNGGAWTLLRSGTASGPLEVIHYNNKYVCTDGLARAIVLKSDFSFISLGMVELDQNDIGSDISMTVTDVAGTWNATLGTGQFWYWITEYDSVNDLESGFVPATTGGQFSHRVNISAAEVAQIAINYGGATYPSKINTNATHWRIYRSGPHPLTGLTLRDAFPDGVRVTTFSDAAGTTDEKTDIPIPASPATTTRFDNGTLSDIPYATITVSVQGAAAATVNRDGEAPTFTTGDIFEDQLVVNDVSDDTLVRYSYPSLIHSFPALYFVNFETKQADEITHIHTVGDVIIIGMRNQIWRLNYLPNETDAEFSRGRCRELVSANHGIMGKQAACIFSMVEQAPMLAYVSHDGLYVTDGFKVQTLTDDLDWEALVNVSALDSAVLVNDQRRYCLLFYFIANGGSAPNNRMLTLSYHPRHLKSGGKLKVAGPTTLTTYAADYGEFETYAAEGATGVKKEDQTAGALTGTARTRIIYPDSIDKEAYIYRQWVLFGSAIHNASTISMRLRKANNADTGDATKALSTTAPLVKVENHARAEGFGAEVVHDTDLYYVGFEFTLAQGS